MHIIFSLQKYRTAAWKTHPLPHGLRGSPNPTGAYEAYLPRVRAMPISPRPPAVSEEKCTQPTGCLFVWQRVSWQGRPRSFRTGNGTLIAQLQQEMEYVHPALPRVTVAVRGGGLIGSSVRGADLSLTSKHIWLHSYLSKCDLGPRSAFFFFFFSWKESNSISLSETMSSNFFFFFVVPMTREIRADGGGCTTRHVTSVFGVWNIASEPQGWLNFAWTPFLHNSAWLHEALYLRWAN